MPTELVDEIELPPIPVDRVTFARLVALARAMGEHPVDVASSLLSSILADDAMKELGTPRNPKEIN
jgi:hypothetical protein